MGWEGTLTIRPQSPPLPRIPGTSVLPFLFSLKDVCVSTTSQPRTKSLLDSPLPGSPLSQACPLPAWLVPAGLQACTDLIVCEESHVAWVVDRQKLPVPEERRPWLEGVALGSGSGRGSGPLSWCFLGPKHPATLPTPQWASGICLFHKRLQPLLPRDPGVKDPAPSSHRTGVWAPGLAFPNLEEPGEDVKCEDGHVATAGEVDGGAQGKGCAA